MNHKITLIFANPRSGSTLLHRLLNHACTTHCIGDRRLSFFRALIDLSEHATHDHAIYAQTMLNEKRFSDEYTGYRNREHAVRETTYLLKHALFASPFGHGYCKTTILGWANDLIYPFVEMAREFFESFDLRIVWLTRDADEVADSFYRRENQPLYHNKESLQITKDLCVKQQNMFRASAEINDVFFSYNDLIANPYECLVKCNPAFKPNKQVMKRIMDNKIS